MTFTAPTPNPEKRKRGRPRKNPSNNLNQSSNSQLHNDAMSTINENLQREDVTWEREIENNSTPLGNIQELDAIDTQDGLPLEVVNNLTSLDTNIQGLNVIDTQNSLPLELANNSTPLDANIQGLDTTDTRESLELEVANVGNSALLLESTADVTVNEIPEDLQLPKSGNDQVNLKKPETSFSPSTTIHIVDGEKGGAGKSFLSRAFIEYCTSIGHSISIVDADTSNQDIVNIYGSVETAFFSDDEKLAKEADTIFDLAFENSVIVNLPAQVYSKVTKWIKSNNLTEIGKENSIKFVKWFVCTGGVDSVNFFLQSLDDLGDSILHVFVKNLGLCDDWKYIQEMPEFVAAQTKYNFIVMDFPKFPFWERNMVDRLGVTFEAAIAHPDLKVISKQRVKNFLKEAYAAFAGTGLVQ
ncbi:cobalamin biosynthesis protein CobQ [Anabaena minutissima FACHB-250]|nr:cobalamin biosynthesis protein CobQ [Anabaena minutissima FACHB-250]